MIDNFALGLIHALLALAALRLIQRADLDRDSPLPPGGDGPEPSGGDGPEHSDG